MDIDKLTYEDRDIIYDKLFEKLKIERWRPSKEELEKEIIDYLGKKHPCSLATCSPDNVPRVSVVDYVNDGLNIHIFSEGGEKFKNISKNNRVAVGIGTSTQTIKSVRGANIEGTAEIFKDDTEEFADAMKLFKPLFDDFEAQTNAPVVFPPGMMRIIRISPCRITYYHYNRGIVEAVWEKEEI